MIHRGTWLNLPENQSNKRQKGRYGREIWPKRGTADWSFFSSCMFSFILRGSAYRLKSSSKRARILVTKTKRKPARKTAHPFWLAAAVAAVIVALVAIPLLKSGTETIPSQQRNSNAPALATPIPQAAPIPGWRERIKALPEAEQAEA